MRRGGTGMQIKIKWDKVEGFIRFASFNKASLRWGIPYPTIGHQNVCDDGRLRDE